MKNANRECLYCKSMFNCEERADVERCISFQPRNEQASKNYEEWRKMQDYHEVKICALCGKEFEIFSKFQKSKKYCSEECLKSAERANRRILYSKKKSEEDIENIKEVIESKPKPKESIGQVNARAYEAGVHYGDIVAQEYMKKNPIIRKW